MPIGELLVVKDRIISLDLLYKTTNRICVSNFLLVPFLPFGLRVAADVDKMKEEDIVLFGKKWGRRLDKIGSFISSIHAS